MVGVCRECCEHILSLDKRVVICLKLKLSVIVKMRPISTVVVNIYSLLFWFCRLGLSNTPTASLQTGKTPPMNVPWPNQLELQNTLTVTLLRRKTPPANVLWSRRLGLYNTPTTSLLRDKTPPTCVLCSSRLRLQNTPTVSLQRGKTTPTRILILTLNNPLLSGPR